MKLPIQMYDPNRDYANHKEEFDQALATVVRDGQFINGSQVRLLEEKLRVYTGAQHVITCGNGTDALFVSLLSIGVGPGDEVITVAHTWISTAETIALTGATPVFVDIRSDNFNMDPDLVEQHITPRTKAILFVSLYGLMPDCQKLRELANRHHLCLIEDGAQSFGAEYHDSKSCSCQYTDIATTSFFPSKPLGCWGDGGAIFTNDAELAVKIRSIKNHGCLERFKHKYIGLNSRLDTIQAAVLLVKLGHLDEVLKQRNLCAQYYNEKLSVVSQLVKPSYTNEYIHVWAQYSLLCPDNVTRDALVTHLKNNGVNISIFYPVGLHKQECFAHLNCSNLKVTDLVCSTIINLPCYGEITREEQDYIVEKICQFFGVELFN